MSDLGRRLNELERIWLPPERPRLLITERAANGRLVRFGTDEVVDPREGDEVIVFTLLEDGLR
ncbi:MAG: hypothetical protein M3Q71_07845 [Chloroflexota bacterium]|nr:hypothetical protein [Chloroflexota bacterium]MDP9470565.1 hypothetical protein [Chloroflexota bacterium]